MVGKPQNLWEIPDKCLLECVNDLNEIAYLYALHCRWVMIIQFHFYNCEMKLTLEENAHVFDDEFLVAVAWSVEAWNSILNSSFIYHVP